MKAIFRAVFDSRSSFFARKPHGNACYAGYIVACVAAGPRTRLNHLYSESVCAIYRRFRASATQVTCMEAGWRNRPSTGIKALSFLFSPANGNESNAKYSRFHTNRNLEETIYH